MDVLEAANAGSIESDPVVEQALAQLLDRDREMLPGPDQIDELEVDDLQALLVSQIDDGLGVRLQLFFRAHALINRHR